jgi:putative aminopeptidase FrvX
VDSFTVGGGPRDNKQFDSVKLGAGPAIRAFDATTMMPESAFRDALARAERVGVPLQYGFMQGGNDASVFEPSGARVLGLGVPLAYSHSNVERIHMGDLAQLVELLGGWCTLD